MLPALLVAAPVTSRFAFARARLAQGRWVPAYQLSSGRLWWRCLRLAAKRGQLHPCAQRLGKHLSWHLGEQVTLTDIRALLGSYAAYHGLSLRTAWADWSRLVAAGWLAPTRAPANQGTSRPQGPGSGRAARYVLTAPAQVIAQAPYRDKSNTIADICRTLRISRATLYRYISTEIAKRPNYRNILYKSIQVEIPKSSYVAHWAGLHLDWSLSPLGTALRQRDLSCIL